MITEMTAVDAAYLSSRLSKFCHKEISLISGLTAYNDIAGRIISTPGIKISCVNKKGAPVIIAGLTLDGHIGETFIAVGEDASNRHWVEISRAIIKITDGLLKEGHVTRLELLCLAENPAAKSGWYEKLGFKKESDMPMKARENTDCCMFVKLGGL